MALRDFQQLLLEQRERFRRESFADRIGRVHEVKGDKLRIVLGGTPEKPMLSPWLHTTLMRGGARERRFFRKGQTVRLSCPGGDLRQATVTHYAESDYYPAPDHADDAGEESETYQQGRTPPRPRDAAHGRMETSSMHLPKAECHAAGRARVFDPGACGRPNA
jgi:hypothetical protein